MSHRSATWFFEESSVWVSVFTLTFFFFPLLWHNYWSAGWGLFLQTRLHCLHPHHSFLFSTLSKTEVAPTDTPPLGHKTSSHELMNRWKRNMLCSITGKTYDSDPAYRDETKCLPSKLFTIYGSHFKCFFFLFVSLLPSDSRWCRKYYMLITKHVAVKVSQEERDLHLQSQLEPWSQIKSLLVADGKTVSASHH